jgi:Cu2+-exporting ATPase
MDIAISFPGQGQIRLQSHDLFAEPSNETCRQFLHRVFQAPEITDVTINSHHSAGTLPHADLRFCPRSHSLSKVVERISTCLDPARKPASAERAADRLGPNVSHHDGSNGSDRANGSPAPAAGHASPGGGENGVSITKVTPVRSENGRVRYFRYGSVVTNWEVKHEIPGRLRLKNPALHRKSDLCHAIERELMSVLGVESYKTNPLTATVLVNYNPKELTRDQIIEIVDAALHSAEHPPHKDQPDLHLPLCTVSIPIAAVAQFAAPGLLPVAAGLFAYTSIPTFKGARDVIVEEKRLGVDVLDAVVVIGCLGTMSIFPGAVLCWCLSFGRVLVKRTQDNSKKLLLNAFGKQPRYVWLYRDGVEVQVLLDRLQAGDTIVVNTGEVVPVDGIITEGLAMIDQHALTGESTPAEKGVGDRVFASTLLVAGKILVAVEKSGSETASAKISQILNDTAGYKLTSQHKGERLADKAVIPTLTLGAVGMATMGPTGAVAVMNSDFGTGIRMAAPLAMLSTLALCASKGILVKDGRALELMNEIDTVLFDKTGTLTRERPEVGRVIAGCGCVANEILLFAAAAEKKFHHPIALAILHKAEELNLELPITDDTQYKVGYGITVQVGDRKIRVGSKRFMDLEGLPMCPEVQRALEEAHEEGHTMVMVGVDEQVAGAIELHASVRPEVRDIVKGLRDRGIKHIAIISGDHEAPTRKLAESLGMDRYFAQVLPADKADYVEKLQKEGKKVCFVGDGINDSIALKKANVSISLRGASTIATDTAHIVFLEQGLSKLCDLRDIARDLDRNVKRSWTMILIPNIACVVGVFTMGFGIMMSVITNNVSAIGALANGMMPLRNVAEIEAEKRHEKEMRLAYGLARKAV